MRVWISREPATSVNSMFNAVWVELDEDRMLTIYENGDFKVSTGMDAHTVRYLLTDDPRVRRHWELISW